jgi:hypothetical protein
MELGSLKLREMTQNEANSRFQQLREKSEQLRARSTALLHEAQNLCLESRLLRDEAVAVAFMNPVRRAAENLKARLSQDGYDFTPPLGAPFRRKP